MQSSAQGRFPTTQWSVVVAAAQNENSGSDSQAEAALASLCQDYWHPLYAFLRRQGHGPDKSQDLVQGFLLKLIERRGLAVVDQSRGKFRSYLIGALKNYLASDRDYNQALKRGGGIARLSIDSNALEQSLSADKTDTAPERLFERRWAMRILEKTFEILRLEYERANKAEWFEQLRHLLSARATVGQYEKLSDQLGISTSNARVAAHRMKRRFEIILRTEVARTLDDKSSVDDEIVALFQALRG